MYIVLTGAKKNLGDFLITERCEALLAEFRPDVTLVRRPSWEPLDLELAAQAKAILILGGPGYQPSLYPKVYPLSPDLDAIPCPIIPMGLGWKGAIGDGIAVQTYEFSAASLAALRWMQERTPLLGCRDWLSQRVLHHNGIHKTSMTGCPVWFDLASRDVPMKLPGRIDSFVYTPPQQPRFAEQALEVAAGLARRWPDAHKIAAFHRGIGVADSWTDRHEADATQALSDRLGAMGFEPRDVAGSLDKIAFYDECDFHIGYRVHAHIYFLSKRRPSLLLHEDGRGSGASDALSLAGVDAIRRDGVSELAHRVPFPDVVRRKVLHKTRARIGVDPHLPQLVEQRLDEDEQTGFARYAGVAARIDSQLHVMRRFLATLP